MEMESLNDKHRDVCHTSMTNVGRRKRGGAEIKEFPTIAFVDNATLGCFIASSTEGQSVPKACDAVDVLSFWKFQPQFFGFGLDMALHGPQKAGQATCGGFTHGSHYLCHPL